MKLTAFSLIIFLLFIQTGCTLKPSKVYSDQRPCSVQKQSCLALIKHVKDKPVVAATVESNTTAIKPDFTTRYRFFAENDFQTVSKVLIEKALATGTDINQVDTEGKDLLHYAVDETNIDLIQFLVNNGANLSEQESLILLSFKEDRINLAKQLLQKNYKDTDMVRVLEMAIDDEKEPWIVLLRAQGVITTADQLAFRRAVDEDDTAIADTLIKKGLDINDDKQLLSYAIEKKSDKLTKYLVTHGFKLNNDEDLLHKVLVSKDYTLADYLIEHGYPKDFRQEIISLAKTTQDIELTRFLIFHGVVFQFSSTDLTLALQNERTEYARLIMQSGVTASKDSFTALTLAAQRQDQSAMRQLLSLGFKINEKDGYGRTALMYVVNNPMLTQWLIKQGADINAIDKKGRSVLMYASLYIPVAHILLNNGANVHIKDKDKHSIIHYAVTQNNLPLAKLVLPYKPSVNVEDSNGNRLLHYSQSMDMTRILMRYKARY
ncbi:MAG: ankyrin repeat domain-containing protein [Thiovulaceae bacterium]|nr:ankyrin repeat domain-containing protein [Sulfurimonadaceae bacterium]